MRKYLLLLAGVAIYFVARPQAIHFSQFYSTPLLVNPASTGLTPGPYRIAGNYRSQWNAGGAPYTTFTISGDAQILKDKITEGNIFGVGLTFVNDKTLNGAVQMNSVAFSGGYHIALNDDPYETIGVGFQGTYNEKRTDFSRLQFENQFGSGGFDPSAPIGEGLESGKKQYFDINAGAIYSFSVEDRSMFAGVAMYNILKKQQNYLTEQFKVPMLFSAIAGGDIDINVNNSLYFSGNYRKQGTSNEMTLGMAYGFFLDGEGFSAFRLGVWHRLKDAIIPYAGITFKGLQLGCSFDYAVSSVKAGSQIKNTFEISLVYLAEDKTELKRLIPWY
ncbi:MAG TPA: PorP/SprF family type IX secretion system membrane protein [Flavitalea sp.]|nr:PorP/SprF family type IX secretion system membrane protein [Flavitalea sp.]